jgi:glucose/arabinose dehydrogenase
MFLKQISSKPAEHSGPQLRLALILVLSMLSIAPGVATAAVPPNFEDTFVTSVSGPTDLTWTPDGRMLIIGKGGQLRVYANGVLLPTPAIDIAARLCTVGEQELVGLAVHPNFATNRYIYLHYTYNSSTMRAPRVRSMDLWAGSHALPSPIQTSSNPPVKLSSSKRPRATVTTTPAGATAPQLVIETSP